MGCPRGCRFEAICVAPSYIGMHGIPGGLPIDNCSVLPLDPLNNETSASLLCN